MRRSGFVARRLGTVGIGALVVGIVLVGTGVAVSAKTVPQPASVQPNKKHPTTTTTTTTTTTLPTTTTTTQPCTAAPVTETSGGASVTMNPGTCIVNGTVVTLTGTGFTPGSDGAFLQCNSDSSQPNVNFEGSPVPVSCINPLTDTNGPGIVTISSSGAIQALAGPGTALTFTIETGPVGPPCGPSACTGGSFASGGSSTDSTGGDPFTDAANYPCGPPGAFPDDSCEITFGDDTNSDPSVSIPITFNPNKAPPPAVTPVAVATTTTAPPTAAQAQPSATKTSSGSLAFTGAGPGLWWLALVGIALMILGIFALVLVDQPRRLLRLAVTRVRGRPGPG